MASRRSAVVVSFLYAPRLVSRPPPALAIGFLPTHSRHDLAVDPLSLDTSGFVKPSTSFAVSCASDSPSFPLRSASVTRPLDSLS